MPSDLGLRIDARDGQPIYRRLFDQLVGRIQSGTFPSGFRLPPSRQLSDALGVHRNTVVRVYRELEEAGFVQSTVGRGTFVCERASAGGRTEGFAPAGELPWTALVSPRIDSDALTRRTRLTRSIPARNYLNLSGMQPPPELMPHDLLGRCIEHVLRRRGAHVLGYAPFEGILPLREQVVADLSRVGIPAEPDDILITTGSQQGIDILSRVLLAPGDTVLVDPLTYSGAIEAFALAGARLVAVPWDERGPDLDALRWIPPGGAKFFYLMPNHLNPTGQSIHEARRRDLVEWSRQAQIPLVEDDYAADLVLDSSSVPPALRTLDREVVYVSTYSKKLIPSLRIGFMVCPPGLRRHLVSAKHATDLSNALLMQHALAEFLDRGYFEGHLRRSLPEYRKRREALLGALRRSLPSGVAEPVSGPRGVTQWIELPPGVSSIAVFHATKDRGVLVNPGALSRVADDAPEGIRVCFAGPSPRALRRAGKLIGESIAQCTHQQPDKGVPRTGLAIV